MSNNPSIVDFEGDRKYLKDLKKKGRFVCEICFHERELKSSKHVNIEGHLVILCEVCEKGVK